MKKIGIMSMQRIKNYGSFMQAYALMKTVESMDYGVKFVDYKIEPPVIMQDNKPNIFKKIINNINFIYFLKKRKNINDFNTMYIESIKKYLKIGEKREHSYNSIDELIIGSDEVFNCLQGYPVGFSRELFGKNYEQIPVITYAACFGNTTLERLKEYKIDREISLMLEKMKSISVRDNNSYSIINSLVKIKPRINLDPVLIYDFKKEIIDSVRIKDYILIYAYINRLTKEEQRYIKKFAKKHKKKIIAIGGYQKIADYNLVVKPFELFSYFRKADYVITDTFHGSVFSIKNHSKFCTIIRNGNTGNNHKLIDLLDRLKQKDRIVSKLDDIERLYNTEMRYDETDNIIKKEKKKTIEYLNKNLIK